LLSRLYIENIAVIEKAEVCFNKGFTVLTGETGAGKSIVLDSLNAVLGERTSRYLVRSGAKKAAVSAVFTDIDTKALKKLDELGYSVNDNELFISREISADGKNLCRVDGRPVSVSTLKDIGNVLVNIHGQHENQALLDEERHIYYLDLFAQNGNIIAEFNGCYEEYSAVRDRLKKLEGHIGDRERQRDILLFQTNEIAEAQLKEGELEALSSRKQFLLNAEKITTAINIAHSLISGNEYSDGALSMLSQALQHIEGASEHFSELESLSQKLKDSLYLTEDIAEELRIFFDRTDYDPNELEVIEQRIDVITTLTRKYGGSIEATLEFYDRSMSELSIIENYDSNLDELRAEKEILLEKVKDAARALRASRKDAAVVFEKKVAEELSFLDMPKVKLKALVEPKNLGPDGADSVTFLFSTNPGEPPKPLAKIASGGELSRVMLAFKNVLAEKDIIGTMIFDEVDAGISGKAAFKVGKKLKETALSRQVICVTHLAQIAAQADNHLYVEKNISNERTVTSVYELSPELRANELARIIGGDEVNKTAIQTAKDMLKKWS